MLMAFTPLFKPAKGTMAEHIAKTVAGVFSALVCSPQAQVGHSVLLHEVPLNTRKWIVFAAEGIFVAIGILLTNPRSSQK